MLQVTLQHYAQESHPESNSTHLQGNNNVHNHNTTKTKQNLTAAPLDTGPSCGERISPLLLEVEAGCCRPGGKLQVC